MASILVRFETCDSFKNVTSNLLFFQINECVIVISMDGGVSNNDFVVQLVSDLTGLRVERPAHVEMSSLGAAFICGLQLGLCFGISVDLHETNP